MRRWLLLLAVIVGSCYPHQPVNMRFTEQGVMVFKNLPINWSFACDFPVEVRAPVREGFTYWNKMVGNTIFVEMPNCGVSGLLTSEKPRVLVTFVPGMNQKDPHVLASADVGLFAGVPRSAVLRYYGTWADYKKLHSLESAARHEVGHVLGFDHSDWDRCLMFPTVTMERYEKRAKGACEEEIAMARQLYGRNN